MVRLIKRQKNNVGLPPGSLIYTGQKAEVPVDFSLIQYNQNDFSEDKVDENIKVEEYVSNGNVNWINVCGLHEVDRIGRLGENFGLHPLLQEDILDTRQRPKVEEYEDHLALFLKMISLDESGKYLTVEPVSILLGKGWVVSFQEVEGDVFDGLRERIRTKKGAIKKYGADYLFYRLLDTIVDNYSLAAENYSVVLEQLEEKILKSAGKEILQEIKNLGKSLIQFKRFVTPLRDAISNLIRENYDLIDPNTKKYLRDVQEHILQVSESIDAQKDTLSSIRDLYMSEISFKMNRVMQVLTIISTIFIPLTFLSGIYGMNFPYMPELQYKYGYFVLLGTMFTVTLIMIFYFRRKKWL